VPTIKTFIPISSMSAGTCSTRRPVRPVMSCSG
jgi:hypothetical protein